jgi:hypothetical protein
VVSAEKARALRAMLTTTSCHTLLLSSEFFFPAIEDIANQLPEAEFVVYVRNPIELLESNYNQSVKRHDETKSFTPPERFQAGLFSQIARLRSAKSAPRLILRPYGDALFEGGDIVSDLLQVLEVGGLAGSPQRVNASYTLDALEFKRHANHFALGPLQPIIDRTLQAYPLGPRDYSLVPPDTYAAMRTACLEQLDQLMGEHGVPELARLREDLTHAAQRPFVAQRTTQEQLSAVAEHLETAEPETFGHLRARVQRSPDLALPNPAFYACFGVTPTPPPAPMDCEAITRLVRHLEKRPGLLAPDYAREIAIHFERVGDMQRARDFMETAHRLRPEGETIRERLNTYRREHPGSAER